MDVFAFANFAGQILDLFGVGVILVGVIIATVHFIHDYLENKNPHEDKYRVYRGNLGRAILLGLEILVAGDIIRSIAGKPDFDSVIILVVIVLVRSFLSITFDMEIEGRWPWKRKTS